MSLVKNSKFCVVITKQIECVGSLCYLNYFHHFRMVSPCSCLDSTKKKYRKTGEKYIRRKFQMCRSNRGRCDGRGSLEHGNDRRRIHNF
jgi:hypothetical protein